MSDATTIAAQRENGRERLKPHSLNPDRDIDTLLADLLGVSRAHLFSRANQELTTAQITTLEEILERLESGEPMAYVRGQEEFWSLSLSVTPDVLIPRPDTERLVEIALEQLAGFTTARILELGTGSGAIALSLAKERPQDTLVATDISTEAINVSRTNYERLRKHTGQIAKVSLIVSDWYECINEAPFDLIISNPPYIAPNDPNLETSVCEHEPAIALYAQNEGMAAIEHVITNAAVHLNANGLLLIEHGWQQHKPVQRCFEENGYERIESHKDLAGHYRVTGAQYKETAK